MMPLADRPAAPGTAGWEHFSHDADLGVRGRGRSLEEAFRQAALALTAAVTEPANVSPQSTVSIHCMADDAEVLLNDWLNALIYEMAVRRMLFSRFDLRIAHGDPPWQLDATAWGEAVDRDRHQPAVEVKGATFTELKVAQSADGDWIAQCVVDV